MQVGENLELISLQDQSSSSSKDIGISLGTSSIGGNYSKDKATKKWVSNQSSILGNEVNINVANNTNIEGSIIASIDISLFLEAES